MKKVLVADGNSDTLFCFRNFFSDEESENIDFVSSPALAVRMLKHSVYDCVISDLYFANNNTAGAEILKEAEKQGVQERIILTALSNDLDPATFLATNIVRKPITCRRFRQLWLPKYY